MTEDKKPAREEKPDVSPESINSRKEAKQAIEKLRQAIRYHNYRYYVLDSPVISDAGYDELMEALEAVEALSIPDHLVVRGEVYMRKDEFRSFN